MLWNRVEIERSQRETSSRPPPSPIHLFLLQFLGESEKKMDSFEASNIVFTKIRDIEPEYVAKKIIGLLLLEDNGEDMIRFAFGPDTQIQSLVEGAKIRLGLTPSQDMQTVDGRMSNPSFVPSSLPIDFLNHNQNLNLDNDLLYNDYMNSRQQQPQLDCERSGKLCQYFRKGYCKNGNKCRYYHSPLYAADNELGSMLLPNSILRLEHDISELLKSKRGSSDPVSTASLPLMYFEKYGRNLQADGYLTESQRHGQTGCNLSSLLARLRSIRLIERPHGQHLVTLAEDALNIRENRGERTNPGPIVHGSRQIYLTFPAASNFTEEDVSDYFSNFGTVEDVRIPWQEQRMFGFVNFADPKTVQIVLSMPNPHYVGDARVLVKAYREKKPANDRNYQENQELRSYLNSYMNPTNMRSERMLSHIENQEKIFEMEKRLSELRIGQMPVGQDAYMGFAAMDDQNPIVNEAAGYSRFWSEGLINYVVDDLSNGSTSQDNTNHLGSYYVDNESQSADLPDSIPTVTPQKKQN